MAMICRVEQDLRPAPQSDDLSLAQAFDAGLVVAQLAQDLLAVLAVLRRCGAQLAWRARQRHRLPDQGLHAKSWMFDLLCDA